MHGMGNTGIHEWVIPEFTNLLPKVLDFSVYVALTNIPVGELLTGFAMRSDPNVVFG